LITALLIARLPGLGQLGLMQYHWIPYTEGFIDALKTGHLAETFQRSHPGVTLTWISGLTLMISRALHGPIEGPARVWYFELAQIIWVVVVVPLLFLALRRTLVVYGERRERAHWIALLSCLLVAIDPMTVAMTRAVSIDGPVSLESALTVCLFLTALRTRRLADEITTGIAAGIAVLTKMPALIFIGGIGLWSLYRAGRDRRIVDARPSLRCLFVIPAVLIATFVVLWPAMWVAPRETVLKMGLTDEQAGEIRDAKFADILRQDPSAHAEDALLDVLLHPHSAGDTTTIFGRVHAVWQYYPAVVLFKTPPVTLLLVTAGLCMIALARGRITNPTLRLFAHLMLFAALYALCANVVAKKTWRYVLPLQVIFELCAGLVGASLLYRCVQRGRRWLAAGLAAALLLQTAHVFAYAPHFTTYYNPLAGGRAVAEQFILVYWGEGAGDAARYMDLHASKRPFKFTSGSTLGVRVELMGSGARTRQPRNAQYLLIDYGMVLQGNMSPLEEHYWRERQPEHVVQVNDVPYIWIYRLEHNAASEIGTAPPRKTIAPH